MPLSALALVGCMPCDFALGYLGKECVPANGDEPALTAEWHAACALIQGPPPNVGSPEVRDIPESHQAYVAELKASALWKPAFDANPNLEVKLVEAGPLLAYQFQVLDGPAEQHGGGLGDAPSLDELFATCLPMVSPAENFTWIRQGNSVLVQTRALNLRPELLPIEGQPGAFFFRIGLALPFVHVVRFEGRCFLHNGYHRTYAALLRGVTHVPCIIRDVTSPEEVGIGGGTFPLEAFASENPPCMHKFGTGQAYPVQLTVKTRTVQLTMTDWVTPEV
jgi:hypothetical protein